jgi:hypothetical protein
MMPNDNDVVDRGEAVEAGGVTREFDIDAVGCRRDAEDAGEDCS